MELHGKHGASGVNALRIVDPGSRNESDGAKLQVMAISLRKALKKETLAIALDIRVANSGSLGPNAPPIADPESSNELDGAK